jgi:hypothetical protein
LIHSSWHYMGLQSRNNQGESNAYPNFIFQGLNSPLRSRKNIFMSRQNRGRLKSSILRMSGELSPFASPAPGRCLRHGASSCRTTLFQDLGLNALLLIFHQYPGKRKIKHLFS